MKKIAFACEESRELDSEMSMHFGRCPFFTVVEVADGEVGKTEVVQNPHYGNHQQGVVPQFIHSLGATVILAGGMGPRAVQLFRGFGIDVATGAVGQVDRVLEEYLSGHLTGVVPCAHDHPESCGQHGE